MFTTQADTSWRQDQNVYKLHRQLDTRRTLAMAPYDPASTSQLVQSLSRVILRMVPFVPGPELYDLLNDVTRSRTSLDLKIQRARDGLVETSQLIIELETGLKERVETLDTLKRDYERYSQLAQVEEDKARALIQQVSLTVSQGKGKERWISLALNLLAGIIVFLLGVWLGPWLTLSIGLSGG